MPELPEVEAVRRRLQKDAAGRRIVRAHIAAPQIAKPQSPRALARGLHGAQILRIARRAKHLLLSLDNGFVLRIHLGMSGSVWVDEAGAHPARARAWLDLDNGRELIFDDPRMFGRMQLLDADEAERFDAAFGPEPLSRAFTVKRLAEAAARSRKPAKLFLMDQRSVAGLGNIWTAESLFAARIDPRKPMNRLTARQLAALHQGIREVLAAAIESAYREYSAPRQTPESEGFGVAVYNRFHKSCLRCKGKIERIVQGGRSTYFCPRCQR